MRIVKCSDIGINNCSFMANGYNLEEVEKNIWIHIDTVHSDLLSKMTDDEIHQLKHRASTFLGRSCGCGHLEKPGEHHDPHSSHAIYRAHKFR